MVNFFFFPLTSSKGKHSFRHGFFNPISKLSRYIAVQRDYFQPTLLKSTLQKTPHTIFYRNYPLPINYQRRKGNREDRKNRSSVDNALMI